MDRTFQSKPFYYRLSGDYALFTDPATKGGGEKFTYQIPTYQALKGITEGAYWKPTIEIFIDEVKVVNQIRTETMGMRPIVTTGSGGNDLSYYTYLKDVEYLVKFHFEWNLNRPELAKDRQEIKHQQIILRALDRGGRRDVFIGTRECIGAIERLTSDEYESANSYYQGQNLNFGLMFHSFTYPDEAYNERTREKLTSNFTAIQMENGVIKFERPEDTLIHQELNDHRMKGFTINQIETVEEELEE